MGFLWVLARASVAELGFGTLGFAEDAAPPNVLLIIADDQGYGDLGCTGNPHLKTPQIDGLAAQSITFDRFFVSPVCSPTRASLLTGRYALRTGVKGVARGQETMRSEEVTIAEVLRDAGYRTGLFGKWHNGEHYPYTPQGQGFTETFGFNLGHWNNYFDTTLKRNGQPVKTNGYITDVLTDAALEFVTANKAQPFFCYVAYNTPHSPFQVPDKYFDRYKKLGLDDRLACIYGMCANIDDNVGRLLAKLDELKVRENTIVIYLSDNGPNGARFNAGMRGTKGSLHEGGTRVPCFLSWPARYKSPRTVSRIAAHIDLFPTLLELCGVEWHGQLARALGKREHNTGGTPVPLALDGLSLVPLLDGRTNDWPERVLITQHQPQPGRAALRTQRYRLVREGRDWELFDMQEDPGETRDVSSQQPDVKQKLIAAYEKWWPEVAAVAEQPIPPIPVGHAEENPVELPVPQANFGGGLRFNGRHANNAWLTGWTDTAARVEWNLDVVRPGQYAVGLRYLAADAGARIKVSAGAANVEGVVTATPLRQVPSPDRVPRDEVLEMEWATVRIGSLKLRRGPVTLTVEALTRPGAQVMELKGVVLRKLD